MKSFVHSRNICENGCSYSGFFFPFVFWVSLLVTVLFRQYIWVFSYTSSYNHSLIRVYDQILFPLLENTSNHNIYIHNIQVLLNDSTQNKSKTTDLSRLTQIGLIGTLERGSLIKNFSPFVLRDAQIVVSGTRPAGAQKVIYPLIKKLRSINTSFALSLSSAFPSTESALTAGILLGGNQGFSYQFRDNIRQAGLLHLTAVSGYNITVLIGSAIVVFKLLGNRFLIIPGVIISIIFFTLITGGGASVIRAALMGAIGFLALQSGSIRSTQRIFVLVALFMLILKPAWLWDVGWELSTAATASLIWIQPIVYRFIIFIKHSVILSEESSTSEGSSESESDTNNSYHFAGLPRAAQGGSRNDEQKPKNVFLESLSASLSAYLATFPILVWRFGWDNISWVGIIANIPAAFLVPWIMGFGALVGFAGLLSLPLAQFIAILGRPPIWALVKIIEIGSWLNQIL